MAAISEINRIVPTIALACGLFLLDMPGISYGDVMSTLGPEVLLNTSDSYIPYWVKTVIKVNTVIDEESRLFRHDMETKLAQVYTVAFNRKRLIDSGSYVPVKRRKRAITFQNVTVQTTNITRSNPAYPWNTDLIYYVLEFDNLTLAGDSVAAMATLSDQEVALMMGYMVVSKAEEYVPPPPPPDSKLWIIGAVLGGVAGLVFLIWAILFIYFKCTRPPRRFYASSPSINRVKGETDTGTGYRDVKGFDVARTELGMQHKQKTALEEAEEYEGMYSSANSPSRRKNGQLHQQPRRVDQQQIYSQPNKQRNGRVNANESRDMGPVPQPRTNSKTRPHRGQNDTHDMERSPKKSQPLRFASPIDNSQELQPHGVTSGERRKHRLEDDNDDELPSNGFQDEEYRQTQREIEGVLGAPDDAKRPPEVRVRKSRKMPKSTDVNELEMRDLDKSQKAEPGAAETETESIDSTSDRLERTRHKMHALLDEVFTLAKPSDSREELVDSTSREEHPVPSPKHTPMSFTPGNSLHQIGVYNPYKAGDDVAKIEPHLNGAIPRPAWQDSKHGYTNPVFSDDSPDSPKPPMATEPGAPIIINTNHLPVTKNYRPPAQPDMQFSSSIISPYTVPKSPHRPSQKAWPDAIRQTERSPRTKEHQPIDRDDDELDAVRKAMQAGSSSSPLVKSIREEIERLASQSHSNC